MRVEDVGSLSPAGDLLAFSIALILTMGVLISFDPMGRNEGPDHESDYLTLILQSEILDADGDGDLEFPSEEMNGTYPDIKINENIIVTLKNDENLTTFLIIDGCVTFDEREVIITSPVRSITVIYERPEGLTIGILSIAGMEVVW